MPKYIIYHGTSLNVSISKILVLINIFPTMGKSNILFIRVYVLIINKISSSLSARSLKLSNAGPGS